MQVICTHRNTDFDALASLVAASFLYPKAVCVVPKAKNPNVRAFLAIHKDLFSLKTKDEIRGKEIRRLIVVDTNAWSRLEKMKNLDKTKAEVILWDHHMKGGTIEAGEVHLEPVGATTTLILERLRKKKALLSPMHATLFLAGIYEDTGNLTFPSTTARDVYAAAYLLENGADLDVLGSVLKSAYSEKQKDTLFLMLKNVRRSKINGHWVSICKTPISGHVDGLSVVVQMYREIVNVEAAFGIFPRENGHSIVIGRSDGDDINIGDIMRSLGGGGHPRAGSAMLNSVSPEAIEQVITELIEGNQRASVRVSDLMSFPVFFVDPKMKMEQAALLLREKGCTGVPVVENGTVVGVLSRRDFKKIKKESALKAPVKAFMSTKVVTIDPSKSPSHAVALMVKHDIGRLPVISEGRLIGVITRSDCMLYFYDLLPS